MLEILLVVFLCKDIGKRLRAKGHKPLIFQIMLVVLWILGEFVGGFAYGVIQTIQNPGREVDIDLAVYLFAILGAACGAGTVYLIAALMPSQVQPENSTAFASNTSAPNPSQLELPPELADPNNPYISPRR